MVWFFLPLVVLPLMQFSNQKQEFLPVVHSCLWCYNSHKLMSIEYYVDQSRRSFDHNNFAWYMYVHWFMKSKQVQLNCMLWEFVIHVLHVSFWVPLAFGSVVLIYSSRHRKKVKHSDACVGALEFACGGICLLIKSSSRCLTKLSIGSVFADRQW